MINVTKAYLPSKEKYLKYMNGIWDNAWLTNNGPLLVELENKLKERLSVSYLQFVSNGTLAIQLAIKALELKGEIITTPYSYVATTTSILWENCAPVFCDIETKRYGIDPAKIENLITPKTSAILATHVYGFPCMVDEIAEIAKKFNLKVIYDGAHAFGVNYKGKSILNYGDISTLSFHATKIFHTVEGGGIVVNDLQLNEKISLLKSFGHVGEEYLQLGINAKNSEFHAAMGLCVLEDLDEIISARKSICEEYRKLLIDDSVELPVFISDMDYNYSYFPVFFKSEKILLEIKNELNKNDIFPRRYFYPALNTLQYLLKKYQCGIAEDISNRVLCLPLYKDLEITQVHSIVEKIKSVLRK